MMQTPTTPLIEDLYTTYYTSLVNYLYGIVHCYQEAEDLAQEVFVKVCEKQAMLTTRDSAHVRNWLYRIATNKAIDCIRKRVKHHAQVSLGEIQPDRLPIEEDIQAFVVARLDTFDALSSLPARQQHILWCVAHEWTMQEIATALSLTESNVKTILRRTRRALQQVYEEQSA